VNTGINPSTAGVPRVKSIRNLGGGRCFPRLACGEKSLNVLVWTLANGTKVGGPSQGAGFV
jgi:hypothetical protein